MSHSRIEQDFRDKVAREVELFQESPNRFRVFTPFQFDDGDHLTIVMKKDRSAWVLSDEANTIMRLTYDVAWSTLQRGKRKKIISNVMSVFKVENRSGELVVPIPDGQFGKALFSLVQAILKISDVTYLSQERIRSTFEEDFRVFLTGIIPENRREFSWNHPSRDLKAMYTVDCYVNSSDRPILIYGLANDNKTRDATITLHQLGKWGMTFRSLAVFEDQKSINRKARARFGDICENQFPALEGNEERIDHTLRELIAL